MGGVKLLDYGAGAICMSRDAAFIDGERLGRPRYQIRLVLSQAKSSRDRWGSAAATWQRDGQDEVEVSGLERVVNVGDGGKASPLVAPGHMRLPAADPDQSVPVLRTLSLESNLKLLSPLTSQNRRILFASDGRQHGERPTDGFTILRISLKIPSRLQSLQSNRRRQGYETGNGLELCFHDDFNPDDGLPIPLHFRLADIKWFQTSPICPTLTAPCYIHESTLKC
ncbi:uncharacterized protein LY79DRAFT_664018 [Colletotrichum navitas]|uniref:Uncharacterized protein n=1 Tax=Colletotrichum navitas TaxID=681940 RepID=A0AAD8PJG6_9PEZI|nr:uncharacterized protein LY79DRAFT_664018 [Colletotrichum navitas]KAK1565883.1 hypothetical protein LY79DRAFT_664018 [Colletotrichum navitas]